MTGNYIDISQLPFEVIETITGLLGRIILEFVANFLPEQRGKYPIVNIEPIDKYKAEKDLDKSLMEMEIKLSKDMRSSQKIDAQQHVETLKELLKGIKGAPSKKNFTLADFV